MRTVTSLREALDKIEQVDFDALSDEELDTLAADFRENRARLEAERDRLFTALAARWAS